MAKIDEEIKASKKYYLEEEKDYTLKDGRPLVKLSKDNVAHVEAMIHHNSDYDLDYNTTNPEKVAFKFRELKSILIGEKNISTAEYRKQIEELVTAQDKGNKTHLNTDADGLRDLLAVAENIGLSFVAILEMLSL